MQDKATQSKTKQSKAKQTMTVSERVEYLRSIRSVRETNSATAGHIQDNTLANFDVCMDRMGEVVKFVVEVIRAEYPTNEDLGRIPIHGRYQHFGNERMKQFVEKYKAQKKAGDGDGDDDDDTVCAKLIDLFVVSVLLDAGAGNDWKYTDPSGLQIGRSEGIAIASYYMFANGDFGNDCVDGAVLSRLEASTLARGLQISETNPIVGFEGRLQLLNKLGEVLVKDEMFVSNRPGDLVGYLKHAYGTSVDIEQLWSLVMRLLLPIWPQEGRIQVDGEVLGDAWRLGGTGSGSSKNEGGKIVTFHKLTQWLTYSLFKPLIEYGGITITNAELMTGLPEYRNGGLFIDLGVLKLKSSVCSDPSAIPIFKPDDDAIVEWRSCTICLLDMLLPLVNESLGYELTLPQLIEAGSWKSGRIIASRLRANGGPPIELAADGTVF